MKWGFFDAALPEASLAQVLELAQSLGVSQLELGCGGYPGEIHCPRLALLRQPARRQAWLQQIAAADCQVGALACHVNPLHPDPALARLHRQQLSQALELAAALEVPTLVTFSGVGGQGGVPNWPVVGWPYEFADYAQQIWQQALIPFWQGMSRRAQVLGVRLALELHGGFLVHSPGTLLALREACGPALGANLDPSHLWWQGIDPLLAIELLGEALFHVHLKDWQADPQLQARWGLLDGRDERQGPRSWRYCLPGEGHGAEFWRAFVQRLDAQGYSGMLSLEHEAGDVAGPAGISQSLRWLMGL
ncbi:MAG: sugar phosphate isomerase/epimerase [Aeromonadaceae bacterium]|nr:sugar phosphate isomerase/epimerase [Aeromonadaceae bacterium]